MTTVLSSGVAARPASVETLARAETGTRVARIRGGGPAGEDLVVKRAGHVTVAVESVVLRDVLPDAGVSNLRWFGSAVEDDRFSLLYIEDAGDIAVTRRDAKDRADVATWFAGMHAATAVAGNGIGLRARGARYFRATLDEAVAAAGRVVAPAGLRRALDRVDAHWDRILDAAHGVPPACVHGDASAKNIRRRPDGSIAVFDWEVAGWGSPATDLAEVDPDAYIAAMRSLAGTVATGALLHARQAGIVLRQVASVMWETDAIEAGAHRRANLRWYEQTLSAALTSGGWT